MAPEMALRIAILLAIVGVAVLAAITGMALLVLAVVHRVWRKCYGGRDISLPQHQPRVLAHLRTGRVLPGKQQFTDVQMVIIPNWVALQSFFTGGVVKNQEPINPPVPGVPPPRPQP
jgi:hypothetical protein